MKKWIMSISMVLTLTVVLLTTAGLTALSTASASAPIEVTIDDPLPDPVMDTPEPAIGIYSEQPPMAATADPVIDIDLVARCIEAEAGTEDLDGKRLAADCIYNMVDAPEYPDNVTDVIMRPGTFSVVSNGMIWKVTPSDESYAAAQMEIENRISWEIMYFRTERYHNFGTPWGRWGNHYFSTR